MSSRQRRPGPPSWLGTLIVAIASVAMFLYAASRLRRAVTPPTPEGAASAPSGVGAH